MPEGETLSALDPCVVGTWGSTLVTMKMDALHAEGGAKVRLTISDSGAAVLDFTPMSAINTATQDFALDFQYTGRASATLKTPKQGVLEIQNADYSGLRVSVRAKPHNSDKGFVLPDRPLTAPSASGAAAPAPSAEPELPGVDGLAQNPVFSSGHYSCADSALMLRNKGRDVTWRFVKADP